MMSAASSSVDTKALLALAEAAFAMPLSGVHGPAHWLRVLDNGRRLAAATPSADLSIIEAFAILHDSHRQTDGHDPQHGWRAARFAEHLARKGALCLTPAQVRTLAVACEGHDRGRTSLDPTIGACWDADRLDLPRVGVQPARRFLSTQAAREWIVDGEAERAAGCDGDAQGQVTDEDRLERRLRWLHPEDLRFLLEYLVETCPGTDRLRQHVLYAQLYAPDRLWLAYPDRADYIALVRAAGFEPPAGLPQTVTIWRGGRSASVEWLRQGRSWSLDRRVSCCSATGIHALHSRGRSMLLRAEVPRDQIAALFCPVLAEVVTLEAPQPVAIDGTEAEWIATARAVQPAMIAATEAAIEAGTLAFPGRARWVLDAALHYARQVAGQNRKARRALARVQR